MRRFEILPTVIVDTRGAEIAEAAAVLPLMFMILLGIFWFGQAFSIYGTITRAAQEGARAGAVPNCTTCTAPSGYATNAATATQNALALSNLDYKQAVWPTPAPTFNSCSGSGVTCADGGNNYICVQVPVRLTTTGAGGTGDCGVSVSFQYPYTFWLPFTSLNKKQIMLRASARVRMETQ